MSTHVNIPQPSALPTQPATLLRHQQQEQIVAFFLCKRPELGEHEQLHILHTHAFTVLIRSDR